MKLIPYSLLIAGYFQSRQYTFNSTSSLVSRLQEYIRFKTISEEHDYGGVSEWLKSYIEEIGLELTVVHCNEEKPIIIGTWQGEDPSLKSILINSHYDVVPVNRDYWDTDPFAAELGEYKGEQVIYGRGSQDDKIIGIIQLETLRMLKNKGFKPLRTIHISIVPDEEISGAEGMGCLVKHEIFNSLNIGAALDEGEAYPEDYFILYYGEKASWNLIVTAKGDTGHSSKFVENLAIKKLTKFFNYAEKFRKEEKSRSKHIELGKVTTMNLVKLGGGTAENVVPDTLWANYNIRVSPTFSTKELKRMLSKWAKYSDVTLEYDHDGEPTLSPHGHNAHVYNTIIETTEVLGTPVRTFVCEGATDSRYLRYLDIPSYAFTPCANIEFKMHDHNEYIPVRCLQTGLLYYSNVLEKIASLDEL